MFSDEQLKQIEADRSKLASEFRRLTGTYVTRKYQTDRGREFGQHGFPRRIKTMARCVENVFSELPPDQKGVPASEKLTDIEIYLQAFLFGTFAALDNLAWIWVCERELKKKDGSALPASQVGLRNDNELVRASFSEGFRKKLEEFEAWFNHIDDYRHALAHRIPLYIPPFTVQEKNAEKYKTLEESKWKALLTGNLEQHKALSSEQSLLLEFKPLMQHSFSEGARPVVFHAQLIADSKTVIQVADGLLEELERKK